MMKIPLANSSFKLDASGIAGFLGGEESFAAMSSVQLLRWRQGLGWYNFPGSVVVARKYGTIPRSPFWNGVFPGENVDPATLLGLDGKTGPKYMAVQSGTLLKTTGHLAHLIASHCKDVEIPPDHLVGIEPSSSAPRVSVTIVEFRDFTENDFKKMDEESYPNCKIPVAYFQQSNWRLATIVIILNIVAAFAARFFLSDWFTFSAIVVGMLCNGASCVVLGSGSLRIDRRQTLPDSPPADGLFSGSESEGIILLKGSEAIISTITRGKFHLNYPDEPKYHTIGAISLALTTQFLAQLFLLPQAPLIGQILFLSTFIISWAYNAYLASMDREQLQFELLNKVVMEPKFSKYAFPKWTSAVAASAFYLKPNDPRRVLDELIPNNTPVWNEWKDRVVGAINEKQDPQEDDIASNVLLDEKEKGLLKGLLVQASIAYRWCIDRGDPDPTHPSQSDVSSTPPGSSHGPRAVEGDPLLEGRATSEKSEKHFSIDFSSPVGYSDL
ncbi:hypothetical protein BDZ97DRAFT_1277273 [Flammula alnicola]|nr:hypothetical protein BDZ97DRAFT_1277273 [Flammula alnicola]